MFSTFLTAFIQFFHLFRSALQVSMSENMQIKPGELVSASNLEPNNAMDQMFAGLGLGSYVSKKDTGAIATGLMSNNKSQVKC